jgi:hypothetical protein
MEKVSGFADDMHARAVADYAKAENELIETELRRRTLEAELRVREAEAEKAELVALEARLELMRKLKDLGVTIQHDEQGNLTLTPLKPSEPNG